MKVQGKVIDSENGQGLPYANVFYSNRSGKINTNTNIGTITDINGNYTLPDFVGDLWITASMVGYTPQTKALPTDYSGKAVLDFEISPGTTLPQFEVTATPLKKSKWYLYAIPIIIVVFLLFWFSKRRFS